MALSILALPQNVIVQICSHIHSDPFSPVGNETLSVLARTCTYFHGPAISVLWRTLYDVVPLLFTLPSDLCVTEVMNEDDLSTCRMLLRKVRM